jgi:hypothetical protein
MHVANANAALLQLMRHTPRAGVHNSLTGVCKVRTRMNRKQWNWKLRVFEGRGLRGLTLPGGGMWGLVSLFLMCEPLAVALLVYSESLPEPLRGNIGRLWLTSADIHARWQTAFRHFSVKPVNWTGGCVILDFVHRPSSLNSPRFGNWYYFRLQEEKEGNLLCWAPR